MGAELVTQVPDQTDKKGFSEFFEENCPYYMSYGMSYDEFWFGSPEIAKFYFKAHEIKERRKNNDLWYQGQYIYDTLIRVAPLFSVQPSEPIGYMDEPYPMTKAEAEERRKRAAIKKTKEMAAGFSFISARENAARRKSEVSDIE